MPDSIRLNRRKQEQDNKSKLLPLLIALFMVMVLSGLFVLWHIQAISDLGNISDQVKVMMVTDQQIPLEKQVEQLKQMNHNTGQSIHMGSSAKTHLIYVPMSVIEAKGYNGSDILYVDHPDFIKWKAYWQKGKILEETFFSKELILPFIETGSKTGQENYEGLIIEAASVVDNFVISLVSDSTYYKLQNWLLIYMLFIIGIIFAAFIIDSALALILKENAFIYHALFLASAMLYMYTATGLSRVSLGDFSYYFFSFGFTTVLLAVWFIDYYLNYKVRMVVYHHMSKGLYILGVLGILASLTMLDTAKGIFIVYGLLIAYGLTASIWAVVSLTLFVRQNESFSQFFVIGAVFQALTIPLLVIGTLTDTAFGVIFKLIYMLAAAVNAVFYTLGIIHESRIFKEDSEYYFKMAITDPLTGANNRYFMDSQLKYRYENNLLEKEHTCYLLIDIDYFKQVNDRYGHDAGDRVLVTLVSRLSGLIRREDLLCRWGGEEFAILLRHTELKDAIRIAEKMREAIASSPFDRVGLVTISIGETAYQSHESLEAWFVRADELLYQAKSAGRNCVKGV